MLKRFSLVSLHYIVYILLSPFCSSIISLSFNVQSNRLLKIEGLEKLQKLEELYISHNGLEAIEGLQCNVSGVPGRAYHFCGPVSLGAYGFTESKKFSTQREFVSVN